MAAVQVALLLTIEIRLKEPALINILRLEYHCLNLLSKNPKEVDMGNDSYKIVFISFDFKIQEQKLSSAVCVSHAAQFVIMRLLEKNLKFRLL